MQFFTFAIPSIHILFNAELLYKVKADIKSYSQHQWAPFQPPAYLSCTMLAG